MHAHYTVTNPKIPFVAPPAITSSLNEMRWIRNKVKRTHRMSVDVVHFVHDGSILVGVDLP